MTLCKLSFGSVITACRLDIILEFGNMGGKQGQRVKQLSKDTALAHYHTCNGLVDLCRHLLNTNHKYVSLENLQLITWKKNLESYAHILYLFSR